MSLSGVALHCMYDKIDNREAFGTEKMIGKKRTKLQNM